MKKTPQLFGIFPSPHQDLRSPPSHPAQSVSPGLTTLNNEIGFKIQRKQGATGTYAEIATPGANVTTYTDNDGALLDGTQYYYKVCATNSAGDSAYSNEANGITPLAAPTALTATAVSSSQISLTWTDNSVTETGYKIEQSPVDNLHYTQIATVGPNVTSYTDTGLSEGTKYYYRVRAYNAIATSAYSSEKNATTLSNIPAAPSGLTDHLHHIRLSQSRLD